MHFAVAKILILFALFASVSSADICETNSIPKEEDLRMFGCKVEQMTNDCQNWFKTNPATLPYAKDCKNSLPLSIEAASPWNACGEAFGDAWLGVWRGLASSIKKDNQFYQTCENDPKLVCKRQLARESFFKYKSDDELRETMTGDLIKKRENVRSMADRDPKYRQMLIDSGVPLPKQSDGMDDIPTALILSAAENKMRELGVQFQCYNNAGYAKMACFAIASIADPTLVAGAGIAAGSKGASWAKAVLGTSKKASRNKSIVALPVVFSDPPVPFKMSDNAAVKIWQLEETGEIAKASAAEAKLISEIKESPVVSAKNLQGTNEAKLLKLESGAKGVWKEYDPFFSKHEIAAYAVDRHLGLNIVPVTVEKKFKNKDGTFQYFVEGTKKSDFDDPAHFLFFDYLINGKDRHYKNYFYHEGRPIAIDNGVSLDPTLSGAPNFPSRIEEILRNENLTVSSLRIQKQRLADAKKNGLSRAEKKQLSTQIAETERSLEKQKIATKQHIGSFGLTTKSIQKLTTTTNEEWHALLKDLDPKTREAFIERKDKALNAIRKAQETYGDDVFPSGPSSPLDSMQINFRSRSDRVD